ncbi:putative Telomere length regulation protein TEL2-like protein [Hypsibius exemplaris]|uniref:Telomere length regulation protein TEL2-like protein n=1 Tax=Hypsibius exemplaris TaxID=2072580 RepID=A0A1W0WTT6_HYPEX|nr:putative Telomere length regulation protein TEL2-like protein [Hypsibius exemplaris]
MSLLPKPWLAPLNVLARQSSTEEITRAISDILNLSSSSESKSLPGIPVPVAVYDRAFILLLERVDATWMDESVLLTRCEDLMRLCDPVEIFFTLLDILKKCRTETAQLDIIMRLISHYVNCCLDVYLMETSNATTVDVETTEEFVQCLASLPDRVAPFLKENDTKSVLLRSNFIRHLSGIIHQGLCHAHDRVKSSKDTSLTFFGRLIGKIVANGQCDLILPLLLKLINDGDNDFVWRRIAQQLFRNIPARSYESLLLGLLCALEDGGQLTHLVGCKMDDPQVELVLTKRLIFNRILPSPKDVTVYRNLFGFLCALDDEASKFKEVAEGLLESWATVYGQSYMAIEYEMSLTKAILIAVGILRTCIPVELSFGQKLLKFTLRGVEKRLSSTDGKVRLNGMLVGEAVTRMIQPSPDNFLKFDYAEDNETISLKQLLECGASDSINGSTLKRPQWEKTKTGLVEPLSFERADAAGKAQVSAEVEELDSDDDLVPYSIPPESSVRTKTTIGQPKYLQDCYEGLCKRDDVVRRLVCLKALPGLLTRQPDLVQHMAVDLLKILLGMELEGSLREGRADRYASLVAITMQSPKDAGSFLGGEVIARNYGIGVRLEILSILRSAAQRLGSCSAPTLSTLLDVSAEPRDSVPSATTSSKTRRIASATKPIPAAANRLTNVSRHYILPLLGYGSTLKNSFSILKTEEALVLSHLVNTLGLLVHYSKNVPDNAKLATRVLEFVWEFRLHSDAAVKQAVLYCVSIVVQTLPLDFVSGTDSRLIDQIRSFLADVTRNDPHSASVAMALHVESLLESSLQHALLPQKNDRSPGRATKPLKGANAFPVTRMDLAIWEHSPPYISATWNTFDQANLVARNEEKGMHNMGEGKWKQEAKAIPVTRWILATKNALTPCQSASKNDLQSRITKEEVGKHCWPRDDKLGSFKAEEKLQKVPPQVAKGGPGDQRILATQDTLAARGKTSRQAKKPKTSEKALQINFRFPRPNLPQILRRSKISPQIEDDIAPERDFPTREKFRAATLKERKEKFWTEILLHQRLGISFHGMALLRCRVFLVQSFVAKWNPGRGGAGESREASAELAEGRKIFSGDSAGRSLHLPWCVFSGSGVRAGREVTRKWKRLRIPREK